MSDTENEITGKATRVKGLLLLTKDNWAEWEKEFKDRALSYGKAGMTIIKKKRPDIKEPDPTDIEQEEVEIDGKKVMKDKTQRVKVRVTHQDV